MVERIGQLLDSTVDGLVPREVDPVAAVLGRARAARTRRLMGASAVAGVVAVAMVVTGLAWTRGGNEPAQRFASPATGAAEVTVADGVVQAGGLRMPIPPGWKVAAAGQRMCSETRLVFINGSAPPEDGCPPSISWISVYGAPPQSNAIVRASGTRALRLPGDQPAWVSRSELEALRTGQENGFATLTVAAPWSGVRLAFAMPRGELARVVGTVRTEPVAAAALVLPPGVAQALVTRQTNPTGWQLHPIRPADGLVAKFAKLSSATDTNGCAEDTDLDTVELMDAEGRLLGVLVVGCGQVTSSLGGRVRVDDNFRDSIVEGLPR